MLQIHSPDIIGRTSFGSAQILVLDIVLYDTIYDGGGAVREGVVNIIDYSPRSCAVVRKVRVAVCRKRRCVRGAVDTAREAWTLLRQEFFVQAFAFGCGGKAESPLETLFIGCMNWS